MGEKCLLDRTCETLSQFKDMTYKGCVPYIFEKDETKPPTDNNLEFRCLYCNEKFITCTLDK